MSAEKASTAGNFQVGTASAPARTRGRCGFSSRDAGWIGLIANATEVARVNRTRGHQDRSGPAKDSAVPVRRNASNHFCDQTAFILRFGFEAGNLCLGIPRRIRMVRDRL